jgi:hypothetical protein
VIRLYYAGKRPCWSEECDSAATWTVQREPHGHEPLIAHACDEHLAAAARLVFEISAAHVVPWEGEA